MRMWAFSTAILIVSATAAGAESPMREWPSARHRGSSPAEPPCSCRGPGGDVVVGGEACMATPAGGRRARCVMVLNNTSWSVTGESCGAVAMLGR